MNAKPKSFSPTAPAMSWVISPHPSIKGTNNYKSSSPPHLIRLPAEAYDIFSQETLKDLRLTHREQHIPFVLAILPAQPCFHVFEARQLLTYWRTRPAYCNPINRSNVTPEEVGFYAEIPQWPGHLRYVGNGHQAGDPTTALYHMIAISSPMNQEQHMIHWLTLALRIALGFWPIHWQERYNLSRRLFQFGWSLRQVPHAMANPPSPTP